jgi:twinfilin-like protein
MIQPKSHARPQMLYASTRNSLTKALGASHFADALFATSRADLTPDAYTAHRAHLAAPKPMSAREREAAAARDAERDAGYGGSGQRANHLGTVIGMKWADDAREAVQALAGGDDSRLVLLVGALLQ